jgi:hypothetical protein
MGAKKKDETVVADETPQAETVRPVTFETIAVETLQALMEARSNDAHRHDIVARALARVTALAVEAEG